MQVRKTALREVKVLQGVRHDNIVHLKEVFRVHKKLFLVFEFVEGTVLQELERCPKGMGDLRTRRVMWQLVRATEYLHSIKARTRLRRLLVRSAEQSLLLTLTFTVLLAKP